MIFVFDSVTVSFDPTTYTVTDGDGVVANLRVVSEGDLTRTIVVSVTTTAGNATGIQLSPLPIPFIISDLGCHVKLMYISTVFLIM